MAQSNARRLAALFAAAALALTATPASADPAPAPAPCPAGEFTGHVVERDQQGTDRVRVTGWIEHCTDSEFWVAY